VYDFAHDYFLSANTILVIDGNAESVECDSEKETLGNIALGVDGGILHEQISITTNLSKSDSKRVSVCKEIKVG
jgi:hypothetical protein